MFGRIAVKLAKFALNRADLSIEDRAALTTQILSSVAALPFRDMIVISEDGSVLVNGHPLEREEIMKLRDSARMVLNSKAMQLIYDQVAFTAVTLGVHTVETERQMFFARASIWWGQQEIKLLKALMQLGSEN